MFLNINTATTHNFTHAANNAAGVSVSCAAEKIPFLCGLRNNCKSSELPAVILRADAEAGSQTDVSPFVRGRLYRVESSDSNAFDLNGYTVARINGEAVRVGAASRVMQPKAARNAVSSVAQNAKVAPSGASECFSGECLIIAASHLFLYM